MSEDANLRMALRAGLPEIQDLLEHIGTCRPGPIMVAKAEYARIAYEYIVEAMRGPPGPMGTDGKPLTAPREWWKG